MDEQVFIDVFITNRTNSSGTLNQATILQPHFEDNSNIFTTYAVLTGDADTGLRNQWNGFNSNAQGIIVGLGPDDTDLVAFQLLSTYYRDSTAAGLAEIRLKMIDPDGDFAGPSRVGTNTNKQQFISWISGNDNPITTADPNPVIHQGISTYYYETDNDFLDTVRHNVGSHITGSALTADERIVIDNLTDATPSFSGNLEITGNLSVTGTTNNANTNAMAYLGIQFTSVFQGIRGQNGYATITDSGAPGGMALYTYIEYTALFTGSRIVFVDRVRLSDGLTVTRDFPDVVIAGDGTYTPPPSFTTGTDVPQE